MDYDKNLKSITIERFSRYNNDYNINVVSLFGAIISLIINYKHYEWILKMFLDVNSSVLGIAFVGVFYIAILVLLILYLLFFAIVGYYVTKLLCKLVFNIGK